MATVLEIVRGISQAMSNTHDGAIDENGDPIKIGLRREEEVAITDKRVVDGFSIRLAADKLCIYYNSEVTMKEVHGNGFENDINGYISAVESYLKKQYKTETGSNLNLKREGESDINVQNMSRQRSWVVARQDYKVGNYGDQVSDMDDGKAKLEEAIENILKAGRE